MSSIDYLCATRTGLIDPKRGPHLSFRVGDLSNSDLMPGVRFWHQRGPLSRLTSWAMAAGPQIPRCFFWSRWGFT